MKQNKFYVYAHIRKDNNQIFYIGKGYGRRVFKKENRNAYWKNIVNDDSVNIR